LLSANRGRELVLEIDGNQYKIAWAKQSPKTWVQSGGRSVELERVAGGQSAGSAAAAESILRAPMPGQVTKVLVQPGDLVKAGAVLVLLEAMKMEVRIQAPQDAKIAQVNVQEGQSAEKEQVLVELEPSHAG
jgi:acetyl/propionyl-CoA carboxylase alpha subunit